MALATAMLAAAPAAASITTALPLTELVGRADLVFVAVVVRQQARWDERRRIVTDVTLRVEECVKGSAAPGDELVLRRLGGVIGDLGMRVEGEPSFADGQRAVLFAQQSPVGPHLRAVGMSQGVMPVEDDGAGRAVVLPGGAGLSLVRRLPDGQIVRAPGAIMRATPLEDLLGRVRRVVEQAGAP